MSTARLQVFIYSAEHFGLPVQFLQEVVSSGYTIEIGHVTAVFPTQDRMTLEPAELDSVEPLSLTDFSSAEHGILTIYHESTHAWLDLKSARPDVAALAAESKTYYTNAPMQGGTHAEEPERVFQEAIASYVGHRTACFWHAVGWLTAIASALRKKDLSPPTITRYLAAARHAKAGYDRDMAQRTFGYEMRGWLWRRRQVETISSVSGRLKAFADHVLLEGRISDGFYMSGQPAAIWAQLQRDHYPRLGD